MDVQNQTGTLTTLRLTTMTVDHEVCFVLSQMARGRGQNRSGEKYNCVRVKVRAQRVSLNRLRVIVQTQTPTKKSLRRNSHSTTVVVRQRGALLSHVALTLLQGMSITLVAIF